MLMSVRSNDGYVADYVTIRSYDVLQKALIEVADKLLGDKLTETESKLDAAIKDIDKDIDAVNSELNAKIDGLNEALDEAKAAIEELKKANEELKKLDDSQNTKKGCGADIGTMVFAFIPIGISAFALSKKRKDRV